MGINMIHSSETDRHSDALAVQKAFISSKKVLRFSKILLVLFMAFLTPSNVTAFLV